MYSHQFVSKEITEDVGTCAIEICLVKTLIDLIPQINEGFLILHV